MKTDRRDAEKLAQSYQAGDLTPVWVHKMTYCRKPAGKVAAAVAPELVGFIWAIGTLVESRLDDNSKARSA